MAHDKISAAALERMAETGEPYAAARRAVVAERQAAEGHIPSGGCALRMSGEIRGWLSDLRDTGPAAAKAVGQALAALMTEGARLGAPLAVPAVRALTRRTASATWSSVPAARKEPRVQNSSC